MRPVADVKQLMQFVVEPAADLYWDGVGTIIDQSGVTEIKPETQGEWDALVNSAYVDRRVGQPADARSPAQGRRRVDADVAGDGRRRGAGDPRRRVAQPQAVFDVGAEVYETCTACHAKYAVDLARPNAQD